MFKLPLDQRLESWLNLRKQLEYSQNPLQETCDFWQNAPFIPINYKIDPYYKQSWPTPWEIIEYNKYDDFTKALMIGWTLKLSKKYAKSEIDLKTVVDTQRNREYNLIYVEKDWVLNYCDQGPIEGNKIPESFRLQNLVELWAPR